MKQRSARSTEAAGKRPASQRRAAATTGVPATNALHKSPALDAQRKKLESAFGGERTDAVQRVKSMPDRKALEKAVASHVDSQEGSCCARSAAVFQTLQQFTDGPSDCGALLLTWAENAKTQLDIGNHTACTVTWSEGTFVVDTTASQFGGPQIFIGSPEDWQTMILGLQKGELSEITCKGLDSPPTDSKMIGDVLRLKGKFGKNKPPGLRIQSHPAKKDDDGNGKNGGKKSAGPIA